MAYMMRTRFKKQIVAEFLPPSRKQRHDRLIILCDGMPSMPGKQELAQYLADKGFWVIYPRYRGSWESDGLFLQKSPHQDLLDILDEVPTGFKDMTFGKTFKLRPRETFVIGGSFGGAAAILSALDQRVTKAVAVCPVVDWSILDESHEMETSNPNYAAYIRQAWGHGYRLTDKNWNKLKSGRFYNPIFHADKIDPAKVFMIHAKDDPFVSAASVKKFAAQTGAKLKLLNRGGHISVSSSVPKYWREIQAFFRSK